MRNAERKPVVTVRGSDCIKQTFCTGGPGGQAQNKVASGVRFIHKPSGAVGESRTHRSQEMNKRDAWQRMCETKKFQTWIKMEHGRRLGKKTVAQIVDETMIEPNLKTEVKDEEGRWTPADPKALKSEEAS